MVSTSDHYAFGPGSILGLGAFTAECINLIAYCNQQYGHTLKCWGGKESRAMGLLELRLSTKPGCIDFRWLPTLNKNTFTK